MDVSSAQLKWLLKGTMLSKDNAPLCKRWSGQSGISFKPSEKKKHPIIICSSKNMYNDGGFKNSTCPGGGNGKFTPIFLGS